MNGMLVVIGAMKCGTSTLHGHLSLHPEISMSQVKELNFFIESRNYRRGEKWYRSHFDFRRPIRGESSPNYTKSPTFPGVAERMHAMIPSARLVYIVRDPIDRAISHYRHNLSQGRETRPIDVALGTPGNDYIVASSYFRQLQEFMRFYPRDQLRLFELDELAADPRDVSRQVFEWVGVDPTFDHPGFDRVLHKSAKKGRPTALGRRVLALPGGKVLRSVLARVLDQPLDRPVLDEATRNIVSEMLAADVASLREFWGRELGHWTV
jgi:hypothetical protein